MSWIFSFQVCGHAFAFLFSFSSFSEANICQVCIGFGCILAKKQTKAHSMVKFIGIKILSCYLLLILWAPQVSRQFWALIHWEIWLEVIPTGSFFQMTPAHPVNRLLKRKSCLSMWGFHLRLCFSKRNGHQPSLQVCQLTGLKEIWLIIICDTWSSVHAGYFVS